MQRDEHEFDDEIRGHLAISIKERIERGEDPESARLAAMKEFGNLTHARESVRAVWRPRWIEWAVALCHDMRIALRSLGRARGLAAAVVITLALGIGANAALFSVVRQVLFSPLVNRDESRLIYIRQSAPGLGTENTTFSVPEIADLRARARTVSLFGDFSTIGFSMVGIGEPRVVQAGVVNGTYFDVMGLRPILGRLLNAADDGPKAAPVAVLTYRFWSGSLDRDPNVIGRTIRLDRQNATVVGVLEPSIPYPADTEIIANVVTSPHHLDATMVTGRTHRMTELFGRLAPGATVEEARAELTAAHAAMMREHPESYSSTAKVRLSVNGLRDQITAPARSVLLLLLTAAAVVFAIACSNVANLILARSVRRESELSVRAALGASAGALRRTLFAESLVLCGAGAMLGVLIARPFVTLVSSFAARFSVRALDVTVDGSLLWVGAGLAMAAAAVLAFVPRLPSHHTPTGPRPAGGGIRITTSTNRRLRAFAVTQMALSYVLLAGAGMVLAALVALQSASTGYNMRQVLAIDVPLPLQASPQSTSGFYEEVVRRVSRLRGVRHASVGMVTPWRDTTSLIPAFRFGAEGYTPADSESPHARFRNVTPGFFATLGVPLVAGRDFTEDDRFGGELVVIVSDSVARLLSPDGQVVNRRFWWTDPLVGPPARRRIVGVVADVDDQNVVPGPALAVYHPLRQIPAGGRLFVHADGDPYALVPAITKAVREFARDQPVERAATLEDIRATVLSPGRVNAFVFSGFAGVALVIAVVGVAGVLAFSVSARTREFGVRLAVGLARRDLLVGVLAEGARIAGLGVAIGVAGAYGVIRLAAGYLELPPAGALPFTGAAIVLMSAAVVASLTPAARAARVDVAQALRPE